MYQYFKLTDNNNIVISDSEFGDFTFIPLDKDTYEVSLIARLAHSVYTAYSHHNENVAKNLARAIINRHINAEYSIEFMCSKMDRILTDRIPNWKQIVLERDEYLAKFMLLK